MVEASGRTLMLLGGSAYLLPVIQAARSLGCKVVTCDNVPDNYAHRHSDAYVNASVVNREAVLEAARRWNIAGIMSFATDPGVVAAAYAAEQLGLACIAPLRSIETLQDKARFRRFLRENGFPAPRSFACESADEALALYDAGWGPVVVKPVDSAGTKGVRCAEGSSSLRSAVETALAHSRCGRSIVEEKLGGRAIESDVFVLDGVVQHPIVSEQMHDAASANLLAPIGSVIPTLDSDAVAAGLEPQLQRLADLLCLRTGLCNVEARVLEDGEVVLMEVSPRGAGANIALIQHEAGGPDLVMASVRAALGMGVHMPQWRLREGVFVHDMLHVNTDGCYGGVRYDPGFCEEHVLRETVWVREGDPVKAMQGSGGAFGSLLLHFRDRAAYDEFAALPEKPYRVVVR